MGDSPSRLDRPIRQWTRHQLRSLQVRPPLSIAGLCDKLAERRGREIRLKAHPFEVPGPFGMWVATASRDYIFYQAETTTPHQNHIILHEIGHILAGHGSDGADAFSWLVPNLPPDAVGRGLRRDSYSAQAEREAELVATIVMDWTAVLDHIAPPSVDDPSANIVADALGDHQGWL